MTDKTTDAPKLRTITLTGRPPVKIDERDWPVIARASWSEHDNEFEFQANRKSRRVLVVRRHEDGRTIVYGRDTYDSAFSDDRDHDYRRGALIVAAADLCAAIALVAEELGDAAGARREWAELAQECIADLPAERL